MQCFEFNKFEGQANEETLIESSLTYIEQDLLWAGLVFDFSDNITVPNFVPYRIRMDRSRIDTTARVLDRLVCKFKLIYMVTISVHKSMVDHLNNINNWCILYIHIYSHCQTNSVKYLLTGLLCYLYRFYHPGPRDSPLPDMKFIVYGFSYIQDMVSHGIIRLHTNLTVDEEIGILAQQFPYPCYIYAKWVLVLWVIVYGWIKARYLLFWKGTNPRHLF